MSITPDTPNNPPLAQDYSGVREYIGARYVPVFANPPEWTDTRAYEPLTIVLHEGNSYTSAQYVPTGIDITNTQYWMLTGNFNAQIEAYRQEVAAFDGRITKNANDIAELQPPDYMVIVGDSWSDKGYQIPDVTQKWPDIAAKQMGVQVKNYAIGGTGFLVNNNKTFLEQMDEAIADTSYNHSKVKYVAVMGGINDWNAGNTTNPDSWTTQIRQIYNNATAAFPNAVVKIFFINRRQGVPPFYRMEDYVTQRLETLNIPAPVKMGWWVKETDYADTNHPNQAGMVDIAGKVVASFTGGTIPPYRHITQFSNTVMNDAQLIIEWDSVGVRIGGGWTIAVLPSDSGYYPITGYVNQCPYNIQYLFAIVYSRNQFNTSHVAFERIKESHPGIHNIVNLNALIPVNTQVKFYVDEIIDSEV